MRYHIPNLAVLGPFYIQVAIEFDKSAFFYWFRFLFSCWFSFAFKICINIVCFFAFLVGTYKQGSSTFRWSSLALQFETLGYSNNIWSRRF